jgi:hypothetical protein
VDQIHCLLRNFQRIFSYLLAETMPLSKKVRTNFLKIKKGKRITNNKNIRAHNFALSKPISGKRSSNAFESPPP